MIFLPLDLPTHQRATPFPQPTLSKHNLEIYFAALIFRFISGIRTGARQEHEARVRFFLHEMEIFAEKNVNKECNSQPDGIRGVIDL